jgi:hypothetical protein
MLMTKIREFITRGVTALPPYRKSRPEIEIMVKTVRVGIGYLKGRRSG